MSEEDINNLKEMLVDFNEYSTDYTKTRCRELEETIENTIKEIERLKKREQECIDHYLVQCKYASEMEDKYITANNIINELEKWIKENDLGKYRTENVVNTDELLNKLQELRGNDKNE